MSDFTSLPLQKLLNRQNIVSRVERLEGKNGAVPSATVGQLSQIGQNTGNQIVDGSIIVIDPTTGQKTMYIDADGIQILASGLLDASNGYKFVDSGGDNMGGLYGISQANTTYVEMRANGQDGNAYQFASVDAVAAQTATTRLTADSGLNAGAAAILNVIQDATGRVVATDITAFEIPTGATYNINGTPHSHSVRTAFTPVLEGTATAGTGTYTTQLGEYSVEGDKVSYVIALVWTGHTGTGNLQINNLPFTASNNGMVYPATVNWNNVTLAAVGNKIFAQLNPNTTIISLNEIGSGAASALPMDTAGVLRLSGWYYK